MRERINELRSDSRAVSPVIGVVLMIAVVVILAAVVGAFATGVFGDQNDAPQAAFSYDDGTLSMDSGDSIEQANLYYIVDGGTRTQWPSGSTGGDSSVDAGESVTGVGATSSVTVVWDDGSGNSATLFETQV